MGKEVWLTGKSKVSECVGAGLVVITWLRENGENQLAHQLSERIETLNARKGYEIPPRALAELRELGSRGAPLEELEELADEEEEEEEDWEEEEAALFEGACLLCGGDHDTHEHMYLETMGRL